MKGEEKDIKTLPLQCSIKILLCAHKQNYSYHIRAGIKREDEILEDAPSGKEEWPVIHSLLVTHLTSVSSHVKRPTDCAFSSKMAIAEHHYFTGRVEGSLETERCWDDMSIPRCVKERICLFKATAVCFKMQWSCSTTFFLPLPFLFPLFQTHSFSSSLV